jgi:thioredoxin 1
MAEIIITEQNFENEVLKSPVPVLIDFWAPWCGPCRIQGPIVEQLAESTEPTKAKIGKLNVDENSELASRYGILSIPTLAIFKNGEVAEQFIGVQAEETLKTALAKHMA